MKHHFEGHSILELEMLRDVPVIPSWQSQTELTLRTPDSFNTPHGSSAGRGGIGVY